MVDEIEAPNPQPDTNNWYTEDGYGGGSYGSASYGGGSYTECADTSQPGVASIVNYLTSVKVNPNCESGHYYLLNNYNPGYYGDGTSAYADISNPLNTVFTIPPSSVPNIGDALLKKNVSFAYFGDQYNAYLANPYTNFTVRSLARYQSDIGVLHDFFESEYRQDPQPDTYVEANKFWRNFSLDVEAQIEGRDLLGHYPRGQDSAFLPRWAL